MECTQRLECTQEIITQTQKECPEQIGFLGICGAKYPVKKGPNKIGRDPNTCNIILNMNSISRQHAVINVLNKKDFMLMDLDSANKTKIHGKSLLPYVPAPLKNGDMVQFGDIFGMFRLFEEEDNLPMTQALEIPDTPVPPRHMSKINAATTIPESPDVSDKDDSFIVASQPKGHPFKSSNTHFIKPGKTISIQPVGGTKIDNIFWNSSKKSTSINLDDSTCSLNDSIPVGKLNDKENENHMHNIHEMNTQVDLYHDIHEANTQLPECPSSIHSAISQLPEVSKSAPKVDTANIQSGPSNDSPSIHTANTQVPFYSPSIHSLDTQLPPGETLSDNRADKHYSIHDANTQMFPESSIATRNNISSSSKKSNEKTELDVSDDIILFDEIDSPGLVEDNNESQAILMEDILLPINKIKCDEKEPEPLSQIVIPKSAKRNMRIKSDTSTDCEDIDDEILLTQNIPEKQTNNGESANCDDEMIELKSVKKYDADKITEVIDSDEVATQVIEVIETPPTTEVFEDMLTQVIEVNCKDKDEQNLEFEDLPTQILVEDDVPVKTCINTKQLSEDVEISPFKVPLKVVLKAKKRILKSPKINELNINTESKPAVNEKEKYYQDTQDLFEDLCSQNVISPEVAKLSRGRSFDSTSSSDVEEKIDNAVAHLSSQEVRNVIGVEAIVSPVKRWPSCSSDSQTPTKMDPFKFADIDLPNSQEIKTSVSRTKSVVSEYSSDSESEHNSEEQNTPILFTKKINSKKTANLDLTKTIDIGALPTRILTRVRKQTQKAEQNKTLKAPSFTMNQDPDVDPEIISDNIIKLKKSLTKNLSKVNDETMKLKEHKDVNKNTKARTSDERNKPRDTEGKHKKKENNRKKTSSSPTKNVTKDEFSSADPAKPKKATKNTEIQIITETKESKRIAASKVKATGDKTRGPIMIEPHSITIPDKPKKREYKRKNKEVISKEPDTIKPQSELSTQRPVRSTRNKMKKDTIEESSDISEKRTRKETKADKTQDIVQRVTRQNTQQAKVAVKSILKKSMHEQSTIYNLSTGSNSDKSTSFVNKRPAEDEISPVPKRSLRSTPSRGPKTCHVLFTAFPHEEVKNKLQKIGAVIVTDVMQCTVVLTLQIRRTFKLLCAVGLGKPIVGPAWVQACADTNLLVDPWLYLIKDATAEKRFSFSLEWTLTGERSFLKGYNVSATPSVMPAASEMKLIVECSGGTWMEGGPNWVCVSCAADRALWPALRERGASLVSTEFILGGVLQQRLNIEGNLIRK